MQKIALSSLKVFIAPWSSSFQFCPRDFLCHPLYVALPSKFQDFLFVSRIFKFHDYELWNQPFFIYYAGHLSPRNTEPHAFLFCVFFSSVISSMVSSPSLSLYIFLLSCYNQKLVFLNKLSKFSSYFFHGHIFMFLI